MTFPGTYAAIKAAIREMALETETARDIMRKSGFRSGSESISGAVPILSLEGSRRVCLEDGIPFLGDASAANFVVVAGELYAWGFNANMFGLDPSEEMDFAYSPVRTAPGIADITNLAATVHNAAILRGDASVWVTDPPQTPRTTNNAFSPFLDGEDTLDIASTTHVDSGAYYLLKSDGTVWAQGNYLAGQGPSMIPTTSWAPTNNALHQMPASPSEVSDVVEITSCQDRIVYRKSTGVVGVWDYNVEDPVYPSSPPANIVKMAGGAFVVLALTDAGEIWATGGNTRGEYGNGTTSAGLGLTTWHKVDGDGYTDVAATQFACFAINGDGEMFSWGEGFHLSGRGAAASEVHTPTLISSPHADGWVSVKGFWGATNAMAVYSDGCIHIWGRGFHGLGYRGDPLPGVPTPLLVSAPVAPLA